MKAVLKGQNVTNGTSQFAVAKNLLRGDALTAFEAAESTYGTQTVQNFEKSLDDVAEHVFPEKAAQTHRRYLRYLKKPSDMPVKVYVARICELNEYLSDFPKDSVGNPPDKLENHEIMDILENGVPIE